MQKIIKKLIPIFFILAIIVSGFIFFNNSTNAAVSCTGVDASGNPLPDASCLGICQNATASNKISTTKADCKPPNSWFLTSNNSQANTAAQQQANQSDESELEKSLDSCDSLVSFSVVGCVQKVFYVLFVTLPSMLMGVFAKMFDFTTALTLSSNMYKADFIANIWKVVRDLANISFILILLYAAIQKILDLGHGEANRIVATVIMVALLVNFSLFFTKVVIDASNITALVFYNKIDASRPVRNSISTNQGEKELAAALVSSFDVNAFFSGKFFNNLKQDPRTPQPLSTTFKISLMVIYGIVAFALSYAFLMAGISMLGRMLTLMMLMIVSPIAFVTKAVPSLKGKDTIGFDSWIGQLFQTSFMAAIFMFILYVISQILNANIFSSVADSNNRGAIAQLIILFMPAVLIVILLLKGVKYAKSASGQFTDMVMSGLKTAGVVGIGGAALTTAFVGRNTVGRVMKNASGSESAARFAAGTPLGIKDQTFGRLGNYINKSQEHAEHSQHSRRDLEKVAQDKFHNSFGNLTAPQRKEVAERVVKNRRAEEKYGKSYNQLKAAEKTDVDTLVAPTLTAKIDDVIKQAKEKDTLRNTLLQASRTGTYDIRNISEVVAKEQGTVFSKLTAGIIGAIGMSMRGGFKQMGVDYGKGQGAFFKDLGTTITDALKGVKINVDLSHVGDEKKESHGGGGGGHH